MKSLISDKTIVRVSSVLNKDVKQFGKKYMIDGNEDTCWNSDQGLPQFIQIDFPNPVAPAELELKFQGGFVGQTCSLQSWSKNRMWQEFQMIHPQDINSLQKFSVESPAPLNKLKIIFRTSSDFFGRITVYHLDVRGEELQSLTST